MKIAFYLATPPAPRPELDAAVQEIEGLRGAFGGELTHLYPGRTYRPWIRRRRLTAEQIETWRRLDQQVDLHHVVSDRPLDYAFLGQLERPVVYRLLTPVGSLRHAARLARFGPLVVSAEREARRLAEAGVDAVAIPPAIDLSRFRDLPPPPAEPFTLLVASAPWTRRQFGTKGLNALLEALIERPAMRLILLGRGVLSDAIAKRLRLYRIDQRVDFIDAPIRPETVVARTHATVLAPTSPRVVKAFPHSLLEALAGGRPILTSDRLAIADWVRQHGCGEVVSPNTAGVGAGLDRLAANYPTYAAATSRLDLSAFSAERHVASYRRLYERTVDAGD